MTPSTEFLCTLCHRPYPLADLTEVRDIGDLAGVVCDGLVCPRCETDRRVSGVDCIECRSFYALEHGTVCGHCGGGLCATCEQHHDRDECASLCQEADNPGVVYGVSDRDFYDPARH